MFLLNFKKDWKMHKSMFITFLVIAFSALVIVFALYLGLKFLDVNEALKTVLNLIWQIVSSLVMMLSSILPIILMFMILKNDLGKNNVHYTIFTPQSLLDWFLPKLLFIFIIQAIFSCINLGYSYLLLDTTGQTNLMDLKTSITSSIVSTFSFGLFGLITIAMALYYSFRKKIVSWTLIIGTSAFYGIVSMIYPIIMAIQNYNEQVSGKIVVNKLSISDILIPFGVESLAGIIMITIALYLFDKKVEY